jgi:hypothetical protein
MEKNNLQSNPAQITKELVQASYNVELTRLNYQKVLQDAENINWTPENIKEDLLAQAKFVASKLTEKKEIDKRPLIDAGKIYQAQYNSVFNPINDVISRKATERKLLADKLQREEDEALAEAERNNAIKRTIVHFVSEITNQITEADTDDKIVLSEKKVGSEMSRKSYYGIHINDLKEQCEALKPLIKKQKEYIRVLSSLNKGTDSAMQKGDDHTAVELRQQAEELKSVIDENKIRLQQLALQQVENSDSYVGIPTISAPNASRTTWKWRVDDLQLLFKKMPHLIDLIPNKEKIDAILKEKRESGQMNGKREDKMFGITFYEEKTFK